MGARQVGIDVEVELRWPLLDLAKNEMLDGIEADRPQLQGLLHGGMEIVDAEGLEQAQNLDVL